MAKFGESSDLVSCSFCGKTQKLVAKLIAGPGCYICNECIDLCNDIIDEELADRPPDGTTPDPGVAGEDEEPRHLREARGALRTRLGRAPTISELAAELDWTEERVARVGRGVWFAAAPPAAGHPVNIAAELAGLHRQVDDLRQQMAERHPLPRPAVADELDTLVAAGIFEGGLRWRLHAAGTDQEYSTVLHLVGYHRGGMGGPKLPDGKLINVYTGRDDSGPLAIAVRADRSVNGVHVAMPDGSIAPLVHVATTDGLCFYVGVAWPTGTGAEQQSGFELQELRAVDHAGGIVATEDLRRWNHPG